MIVAGILPGKRHRNLREAAAKCGGVGDLIDVSACQKRCDGTADCACKECTLERTANLGADQRVYACPMRVCYPLDNERALANFAELLHAYHIVPLRAVYPTEVEIQRLSRSFLQ